MKGLTFVPLQVFMASEASSSGGGSASTLFAKLMKASCKSAVISFRKSFFRPDLSIASIALSKATCASGILESSSKHLHCRMYSLLTI